MSARKLFLSGLIAVMALAATPNRASADWLFTPYFGGVFGGRANFGNFTNFDDELEKRATFGASLGWMGAGVIGAELDFGFSPNFFENTVGSGDFEFGDSNVTTLMGNLILGVPIGGQHGLGLRPYASGGVGLIRSRVDGGSLLRRPRHQRLRIQRRRGHPRLLHRQHRHPRRRAVLPLAGGQRAGRRIRPGPGRLQFLARHGWPDVQIRQLVPASAGSRRAALQGAMTVCSAGL